MPLLRKDAEPTLYTLQREILVIIAMSLLAHMASPRPVMADSCLPGENDTVGIIKVAVRANVREQPTTKSPSLTLLVPKEKFIITGLTNGEEVKKQGEVSSLWDAVVAADCQKGFVSDLFVGSITPESRAANAEGEVIHDYTGSIFQDYGYDIQSAIADIHFPNQKYMALNVDQLNRLLSLKNSRSVTWNGYGDNVLQKFDRFYYPSFGKNYAEIYLNTNDGQKTLLIWQQNPNIDTGEEQELLYFLFRDMEWSTDSNGDHNGTHHFLWGVIQKSAFDRIVP